MIMFVVAVYDKKVGAFMQPQFYRSKGEAIRSWMDACVAEAAPFKRHAEDYVLMHLGYYDDGDGQFGKVPNKDGLPEPVMTALDAVSIDGSVN